MRQTIQKMKIIMLNLSIPGRSLLLLAILFGTLPTLFAQNPKIVGHRGLENYAPENTMVNFKISLGLNIGIEVDVRRTKDGVWVCLHDDSVDRTSNAKGKVKDYTYDELQKLDVGSSMSGYFKGERIPKFEDLLSLLKEQGSSNHFLAIDLKERGLNAELELVTLAKRYGVLKQLLFIGYCITDQSMRKNFYEADRETQIAVLVNSPSDLEKGLLDPYANWTYNRYIPDKTSIEKIHSLNKKVFIVGSSHIISDWKTGAEQAKEAGVDAVLTDYPLEWQKAIHLKKM